MQKKKLLFVIDNMKIGGIQKNTLNSIIELKDKFDITLCIFHATGDYFEHIPSDIKIIQPDAPYRTLGMSNAEAKKKVFYFLYSYILLHNYAHFWQCYDV